MNFVRSSSSCKAVVVPAIMTETPVSDPSMNDVLFGRGGATNNHVGNKGFRILVSEHQPEYLAARKRDKSTIARQIVDIIHRRGGRFLKKVDDKDEAAGWIDVGDKKATEKTSQALREGLEVRVSSGEKRQRSDSGEDSVEELSLEGEKKRRRATSSKEERAEDRYGKIDIEGLPEEYNNMFDQASFAASHTFWTGAQRPPAAAFSMSSTNYSYPAFISEQGVPSSHDCNSLPNLMTEEDIDRFQNVFHATSVSASDGFDVVAV